MIFEFLYIALLLAFGALALARFGFKNWISAPAGLVFGLSVFVSLAHLQIALGIDTNPLISLSIILICTVLLSIMRLRSKTISKKSITHALTALLALLVIVGIFWNAKLTRYHYDSFRYLTTANLIADDQIEFVSTNLAEKRISAVSVMHAPASLYGQQYIRSITPVIGISLLALVFWSIKTLSEGVMVSKKSQTIIAMLGVLLLASNRTFVWHFFYLNGHLLYATFALMMVVSSIMIIKQNSQKISGLTALQCAGMLGLVLSRQEGAILALFLILPFVIFSVKTKRKFDIQIYIPVLALAAAILLKETAIARGMIEIKDKLVLPDKRFTLLAFMLVLAPLVLKIKYVFSKVGQNAKTVLVISEIAIWGAVILLAFLRPDIIVNSIYATAINLLGAGGWGYSLILFFALFVAAVAAFKTKDETLTYLRYCVTTFLPAALLLAFLRDGTYRIHTNDSLNRMWAQIIPLVAIYIALGVLLNVSRKKDDPIFQLKLIVGKIGKNLKQS